MPYRMKQISWVLAAVVAVGLGPLRAAPEEGAVQSVPVPSDALRDRLYEFLDDQDYGSVTGKGQYKRCLDRIPIDPDGAFDMGTSWRDQGGGAPARHCIALALVELGHYGEAAVRLEMLTQQAGAGDVALRAQILSQAGNAWLLEEQGERAVQAFSAGIDLAAQDARIDPLMLVYDRARAHALLDQWGEAEDDLTSVLKRRPEFVSALVLRASARRNLGKFTDARKDVRAALQVVPDDPGALIEMGLQHSAQGDKDGAREAWSRAAVAGDGTVLADAARDFMTRLDLLGETPGVRTRPVASTARREASAAGQAAPAVQEAIAEAAPLRVPAPVRRPASAKAPQADRSAPDLRLRPAIGSGDG